MQIASLVLIIYNMIGFISISSSFLLHVKKAAYKRSISSNIYSLSTKKFTSVFLDTNNGSLDFNKMSPYSNAIDRPRTSRSSYSAQYTRSYSTGQDRPGNSFRRSDSKSTRDMRDRPSKQYKQPFNNNNNNRNGDSRRFDNKRSNHDAEVEEERLRESENMDENLSRLSGKLDTDIIYGISPVKIALMQKRRQFYELVLQEGMELSNKKDSSAIDILKLAKELSIVTRPATKHDMNLLSDLRPHQGFILRVSPLKFRTVTELPPSNEFKYVCVYVYIYIYIYICMHVCVNIKNSQIMLYPFTF
jgi:hypothetical protein